MVVRDADTEGEVLLELDGDTDGDLDTDGLREEERDVVPEGEILGDSDAVTDTLGDSDAVTETLGDSDGETDTLGDSDVVTETLGDSDGDTDDEGVCRGDKVRQITRTEKKVGRWRS